MRISTFLPERRRRSLEKRRGGGGRGGGGGGGGRGGGSSGGNRGGGNRGGGGSSGGSGGGSSGGGRPVSLGGSGAGGRNTATAYGFGGGPPSIIPAGQPFSGRSQGGGTRNDVYGTNQYGSGYPGSANQRGVASRGFPFFFWPVVWGGAAGAGGASYLHSREYGDADNSTRPGGPLFEAPFKSATQNTTLHIIADNSTAVSLIESVKQNCSSLISPDSISTIAFNPNATNAVKPEQAIQYYRASSVVLTLDGYNDTSALSDNESLPSIPLPAWVDRPFLDCVNLTIGAAVPLIDPSSSSGFAHFDAASGAGLGVVCVVGTIVTLLQVFV